MTNIAPKVSVIIPTYNRGNQLRICLKSLQKQSFKNFETIVCDDGSTDNTFEIIKEFKDLPGLKYIRENNFGGPARPRNNGLKEAKGENIAFLDSDDWWYPNKLEVSLNYLSDYDLIYHDLDIYTNEKVSNGVAKGRILKGDIVKDLILNGNGIINSSVVIRKSIVDLVGEITEDKKLIAVEDYDYWIRVARTTNRFKYINKSLGGYRVGENISYSTKQIDKSKALLKKYIHELTPEEQRTAISFQQFNASRLYHSLALYPQAKASYLKSMHTNNLQRKVKSLLGYVMCVLKIK